MGHIRLSREADLLVACPASAGLIARAAAGLADDLASTVLLATDKPVLMAPAMNVRMWRHPATERNVRQLRADGIRVMDPDEGSMACGEYGPGRLPEPPVILAEIERMLGQAANTSPSGEPPVSRPLNGRHLLVTAGPTHEPIDPVRYIANRSSGLQGFAIAEAAAALGARVSLVTGPVSLPTPRGVDRIDVRTALEMADAVDRALPADAAVFVAAVADWRVEPQPLKIKKQGGGPPQLRLVENPDILARVARAGPRRPKLVIGFAAETNDVIDHAAAKRQRKGADWIVANDVGGTVMGGARNQVQLVTDAGVESWDELPKQEVARRLVERIAAALG